MAGTLFGLPLSQQLDEDGDPYSGALLYIYEALTSTPADTYADHGLSTLNAFPMEADASGRIPQFWVDDGSYRARLTTAGGVEIFDEDSILAIGPSVASTGGSSGGTTTTTGFSTGDMKWKPVTGSESSWVRANARTIGSASSGATERASSDTQALFEFFWNNFSNTLCPVLPGRGADALADFAANKTIGTLDMRGYGIFGLDDMGSTAASRLVTGTPTTAASATGAEKTSITLATANLPSHTHNAGTLVLDSDALDNASNVVRNLGNDDFGTFNASGGGNQVFDDCESIDQSTLSISDTSISGSTAAAGSGTAYVATTISPGRLGTWYIKL